MKTRKLNLPTATGRNLFESFFFIDDVKTSRSIEPLMSKKQGESFLIEQKELIRSVWSIGMSVMSLFAGLLPFVLPAVTQFVAIFFGFAT